MGEPRCPDDFARQVRLTFAAGESAAAIRIWLREAGMSAEDAEAFLSHFPQANRAGAWARRYGAAGFAPAGIVGIVATLFYRPRAVTWVGTPAGQPIDPIPAVWFHRRACDRYIWPVAAAGLGPVKGQQAWRRLSAATGPTPHDCCRCAVALKSRA